MALSTRDVDPRTIGTAVLVTLAITLPPVWVVRIMKGDDLAGSESNLWFLGPLALLIGFSVGGHLAARRRPDTPLLHSVLTGLVAYGLIAVFTIIRRAITGGGVGILSLLLLGQIAVSVALLGGYVAMRRAGRDAKEVSQ